MEQQYTNPTAKRIMEISDEVQQIIQSGKDNPVVSRIYALNEELIIIFSKNVLELSAEQRHSNRLIELLYAYLDSSGQLEDFDEFAESHMNAKILN